MLQSSQFDGVAFDPFSFQKDGLASAEVDVGRCQVLYSEKKGWGYVVRARGGAPTTSRDTAE